MIFMGIKSDIPTCVSFANIVPIHQVNNNIQNHVHINSLTQPSLNDYCNSNIPKNKDPIIVKHNMGTLSKNQDHPRKTTLHKENNNIDLSIFHQNIRGLY